MEETTSATPPRVPNRAWRFLTWLLGSALTVTALAILFWWLPARANAGYIIPDTRGVLSQTPTTLKVFWVRPFPWSTQPPAATVTLEIPGQRNVTATATPSSVSFWSARAVMVSLSLSSAADPSSFLKSGLVSDIKVSWQGGSAQRSLHNLWVVHAFRTGQIAGFAPLATSASGPAQVVLLLSKVPHAIVAVSSLNPLSGPWRSPRCESVQKATRAAHWSLQHTAGVLRSASSGACSDIAGPQALVVAGKEPALPVIFVWDPVLEELAQGHIVTVSSGVGQSGPGITPNAFNWWWFTRSSD